jgi:hypothetical protein
MLAFSTVRQLLRLLLSTNAQLSRGDAAEDPKSIFPAWEVTQSTHMHLSQRWKKYKVATSGEDVMFFVTTRLLDTCTEWMKQHPIRKT